MKNRVVITSMGFVTSMGTSEHEIMNRFKIDTVGFRFDDDYRRVLVCPVPDFDLRQYTGRLKN
ncbi:MAG: beta-ketoacyl-[acyl-carrier-protein] synthase family protein, partial [Deltaproteobacteria bacterium]